MTRRGPKTRHILKKLSIREMATEEDALAYLRHHVWLAGVPEALRTPAVCLAAVQHSGWQLEYVPQDQRTAEVCLAAVRKRGLALELVPRAVGTDEIYLAAIQQEGTALAYVPRERRTLDLCRAAVLQSGEALEFVPDTLELSADLYLAAALDSDARIWLPARWHRFVLAVLAAGLSPHWFKNAQADDTLEQALDRVAAGLGAHHQMLAAIGLTGTDLEQSLRLYLQQAVPAMDLPRLPPE